VAIEASTFALKYRFASGSIAQGDSASCNGSRHRPQVGNQRGDLMFVEVARRHRRAGDSVLDDLTQFFVRRSMAEFATRQIHTRHGIALRTMTNSAIFDEELLPLLDITGRVPVLRK
jgi:hypothetical protein